MTDPVPQRIILELWPDVATLAVSNFRALSTGEKGKGQSGKALHYKGCKFHRVIKGFVAQGIRRSTYHNKPWWVVWVKIWFVVLHARGLGDGASGVSNSLPPRDSLPSTPLQYPVMIT